MQRDTNTVKFLGRAVRLHGKVRVNRHRVLGMGLEWSGDVSHQCATRPSHLSKCIKLASLILGKERY